MNFLPVGLRVDGRRIVVIGGGRVAAQKCRALCATSATVCVYAHTIRADIRAMVSEWRECAYQPKLLRGAFLVYACTSERELNRRIAADARAAGILVNVADDPNNSDFISPAVWTKGRMSVAVSSDGTDPRRSIAWRNAIREWCEHDTILR